MQQTTTMEETVTPLSIPSIDEIKKDLAIVTPTTGTDTAQKPTDPKVNELAEGFVNSLFTLTPEDTRKKREYRDVVECMGSKIQKEASRYTSKMLDGPIKQLSAKGADGGDVASSLVDLKMQIDDLDPSGLDFSQDGWLSRAIGNLPFVGNSLERYFTKFESSKTVINVIITSLNKGAAQLKMDIDTLRSDQDVMRKTCDSLKKAIAVGQVIDQKLAARIDAMPTGDPMREFYNTEILFPLRQRLMDLEQSYIVNQQGVIATELICRNNVELIRGVDRVQNVTINALNIGVTIALALAEQKKTIEKIEKVNKVTDKMIESNAEKLATQGVEIHKRAASAQIDPESLKRAHENLNRAIDEINTFRQDALPQMAQTILELDDLSREAEESIKKMEKGNRIAPTIIDIVDVTDDAR